MIEVSSKFVCCLARISQPRGDLNPERGSILNETHRKRRINTSTNAKPAQVSTMLLVTIEYLRRPKFMSETDKVLIKEILSLFFFFF